MIMAKEKPAEFVSVVVLKGKFLRHDGEEYPQNTRVSLPEEDAKRLMLLGFVKTHEALLLEAEGNAAQEVSVTKTEGQATITTSADGKSET